MSSWAKHQVVVVLPLGISLALLGMVALMSSSSSSSPSADADLLASTSRADKLYPKSPPESVSCTNFSKPVVSGIDVTSYWDLSYEDGDAPTMGIPEYSTYSGMYGHDLYYFANEENLGTFLSSPSKFWPQFGSFCSYGISVEGVNDDTIDYWDYDFLGPFGDPQVYTIYRDRLYIFMNSAARSLWLEYPDTNNLQGQTRWANWAIEAAESGLTDDYYTEWQPMNTMCLIDSTVSKGR